MKYTEELIIKAIKMYKENRSIKEIRDAIAPERQIGTFNAELCIWRQKLGVPTRQMTPFIDWKKIKENI